MDAPAVRSGCRCGGRRPAPREVRAGIRADPPGCSRVGTAGTIVPRVGIKGQARHALGPIPRAAGALARSCGRSDVHRAAPGELRRHPRRSARPTARRDARNIPGSACHGLREVCGRRAGAGAQPGPPGRPGRLVGGCTVATVACFHVTIVATDCMVRWPLFKPPTRPRGRPMRRSSARAARAPPASARRSAQLPARRDARHDRGGLASPSLGAPTFPSNPPGGGALARSGGRSDGYRAAPGVLRRHPRRSAGRVQWKLWNVFMQRIGCCCLFSSKVVATAHAAQWPLCNFPRRPRGRPMGRAPG